MAKNTYTAWALYTGPNQPTPLWENSQWITGEWDGVKGSTTEDHFKKDIDARIDCLIESFKISRANISSRSGTVTNYFVVPEFYFHSTHGPYPAIEINGIPPYEYICTSLWDRIKGLAFDPAAGEKESWIICAGSVLTCNIPDIEKFLQWDRVKRRLDILNKAIGDLSTHYGYRTAKDFKKSSTHIKARGYMEKPETLSEPHQHKAINALMDKFRADPLCVVRNRGLLLRATFRGQSETGVECRKYEKQMESTVDLTMGKIISKGTTCELEHGGMITQWMSGYPSISIIDGDKNTMKAPMAARITMDEPEAAEKKLEIGVEVCLDHRLKRLRRTVGMTKENGAEEDNPAIHVQLVTSGGMQILEESVSAGVSGVIFNSDGCDPILKEYTTGSEQEIQGTGTFKKITCGVYAASAQTMVEVREQDDHKHDYYSHSQLSFRYGEEEIGGYNNALGIRNKKGRTYDPKTGANERLDAYSLPEMITLPPQDDMQDDTLFAAGMGDLHIYR
ncbi:MAG: hypothetical protein GY757_17175 [bacterium]|nr:hypothetical protein [bacterium]